MDVPCGDAPGVSVKRKRKTPRSSVKKCKKASDLKRDKTRIALGGEYERWCALKTEMPLALSNNAILPPGGGQAVMLT